MLDCMGMILKKYGFLKDDIIMIEKKKRFFK